MAKRDLKFKKSFLLMLALMSVFSLLVTSLKFFGWADYSDLVPLVTSAILGFALILESGGLAIFNYHKGGFDGAEVVHIVTALLGLVILVGALVGLSGGSLEGTSLGGVIALGNAVASIFVIIQAFV